MTMRRSARSISRLPMVWVLGVAAVAVRAQTTNSSNSNNITNETVYVNCDLDVYYAELLLQQQSAWTRAQVQALIVETHRNVLPYKGGSKDEETIAFALIDLDPGLDSTVDDPTVRMYDRDLDFAASKQTPEGWKRADFWPLSRGANLTTDASTDVHGKRPADWEVDSVLQDLFWGVCGTVESAVNCVTPAVANQTAATTAQDGKVKTPHEGVRGAVARSVLYTAVRYELELGLALTDCPPFATTEYGYLSELLNWHAQYPPDQREQDRNDRACSRWQGNRNPFVDFPDLVSTFFGEPDVIQEGSFSYSQCVAASIETMSPTATPNDCSALQAGDVAILIFNSDPVDQIALFPLVDISPSVGSLFITNRAWNGTDFCNNNEEGTIEYSIAAEGRRAGRMFGYGVEFPDDNGSWQMIDGTTFDLSTLQPDNLFVYCLNADDEPHFLHALTYNDDGFLVAETAAEAAVCESTSTLLPDAFEQGTGALALPFGPNYVYDGNSEGNKVELLAAFADPANYKASNIPYEIKSNATPFSTLSNVAALVAVPMVVASLWFL